jgi:hypothetical protein
VLEPVEKFHSTTGCDGRFQEISPESPLFPLKTGHPVSETCPPVNRKIFTKKNMKQILFIIDHCLNCSRLL